MWSGLEVYTKYIQQKGVAMTEKVLNVKKVDRVEDENWVASKSERKTVEAGKAPAPEAGVDPKVEWEEKNREEAVDSDLEKPVHAVATNKNRQ